MASPIRRKKDDWKKQESLFVGSQRKVKPISKLKRVEVKGRNYKVSFTAFEMEYLLNNESTEMGKTLKLKDSAIKR